MGITGAKWCDFIVYTQKGMSIQRIPFNQEFWWDLERKLSSFFMSTLLILLLKIFSKTKIIEHHVSNDKASSMCSID